MKRLLALAATSLLLTSCSSSDDMTVGLTYVPDVQFFPFYVAEDNGYFDDHGLDITIRHHGGNEGLFTALATGREDVVYAGADELLVAHNEGVDAVSFATMYQTYPLVLIVPEDSPVQSPADMAGKTVGIPGEFGSNYYGLLAMKAAYGLEDMSVQSIGYTQMAALSRGDVDAVIGFVNNDAVAMESQGFDVRTIELAPDLPLVSVGLIASAETIDKTDELKAMIAALDEAVSFAESDPEATLDIVAKHVPTMSDRDAALATLEATIPLYRGGDFGSQDEQRWEMMSEFLAEAGITEKVDVSSVMREITK